MRSSLESDIVAHNSPHTNRLVQEIAGTPTGTANSNRYKDCALQNAEFMHFKIKCNTIVLPLIMMIMSMHKIRALIGKLTIIWIRRMCCCLPTQDTTGSSPASHQYLRIIFPIRSWWQRAFSGDWCNLTKRWRLDCCDLPGHR